MQHLDSLVDSLRRGMGRGVQTRNETLGLLRRGLNQQHPRARIQRSLDLLRERMARLQRGMVQRMQAARQDLEVLASTPTFREPLRLTASRQEGLQALRTSLLRAAWRGVSWQRERLDAARGRLEALSPLRVLERGYALVLDRAEVVSSVEGIRPGDRLEIRLRDGAVKTRVEEVEEAT
jgi:exodeoxyribonuclease VII large subunit